jgi:4-amino-4-deoxy-L-arabinose transferase-like glycosyltransferase
VTLVAADSFVEPSASGAAHDSAPGPRRPVAEWLVLAALLAATALLYLWNLSASGWANAFYSAAAQAGASDWTAMLFGSSDAANAVTVDKIPAALWVMDLSVRLFGLNSWSVLVPQALEGVAAAALLYAGVRRAGGPAAAAVATAVFAVTPVAALIFRFNNPDALLVLLLVAGAYCVQRACEKDASRWWFVAAGALVGFGFLAKMLQALLVVPGFAAAYLVAGSRPLRGRLAGLLGGGVALVVASGWYLLLVELWPASARPYIGGSQHNSVIELALGYNGFGRLTGDEPGGLGNLNLDVGWGRLFGALMGTGIAWLLPAALIGLGAGLVLTRRAPRTDPVRAALILWGGWLLVTAGVFSFMNGIMHPYYAVALAPPVAALSGLGAVLLWRRRADLRSAVALSATVLVTTTLAAVLLSRNDDWLPWLRAAVAVGGVGAAALLPVVGRLARPVPAMVAALAVFACLGAPTAYTIATAASPHVGSIPSVGPSPQHGGPHGGGFAGPGGLLASSNPGPALVAMLTADAHSYRWPGATVGSNTAAGYQLAARVPVMAVGGFNGTDPAPTLAEFQNYVAQKQIHYFIRGAMSAGPQLGRSDGSGSREAADIEKWVRSRFTPSVVGGVVVYDLTQEPPNS